MKFLRNTLSLLVFWAVLSSPSAAQDAKIIPHGENLAVNPHTAEAGWASRCVNFFFDNGRMVKRDGYKFLVIMLNQDFTGLWTYIDDNGDKRLIGSAQYSTNNYQSLYVSSVYSYDIGSTSLQDYIYLGTTPTAAVYNGIFILANGKNRPYRYNGTDFRPLVEVPPGSFDFAPEKPAANTPRVLKGKYYYGWQAAIPDSVIAGAGGIFHAFADSMNLTGPSWRVVTDSDWVRIFSRPFTGKTKDESSVDSTVIRLGRTRAGREPNDSMFLIAIFRWETVHADWSYIDSIPDDSLLLDIHKFIGFIDTVTHVADTESTDSLYRIGQPQWGGTVTLDSSSGISADDTLLGKVVYRRYVFSLHDTSTGMTSPPGPFIRIPADTGTGAPGKPQDSLVTLICPPIDTALPYWGVLYRADERLDSIRVDTVIGLTEPSYWPYGNPWCVIGELVYIDGNPKCKSIVSIRNNIYTILEPYYPVCTLKTQNMAGYWVTDRTPHAELAQRNPMRYNEAIGQFDNVTILKHRVLTSQGNKVYFNGFTEFGSEMAYWPAANFFAVGNDETDEVTALHSGDNYVDAFTNHAWYRAKETGTNEFTVFEILNDVGCIATNSVVDIPGGGLAFLAIDGIYMFGSHWASPYKESGGNLNRISDPIWPHIAAMSPTTKSECYGWLTKDKRNLVFSFPTVDTSYVLSLATGDWSQWTFAPRMTTEYDISPYRYYGLIPCSGTVFIEWDNDSLFRFGATKLDLADTVQAWWKSLEMFQTGEVGRISEFKIWKQSNDANGIDFSAYDILDTGVVATVRDSTGYRVRRQDINCPESEAFKIEIKSYADSLAVDRIDIKYLPTGLMPVD